MRMNKVTLVVTALLATSQIHAAGFQVSEHSASGLGRAFAGEAAIGDNAAALARNPALMTMFDQAQLSIVGSYVAPEVNIENTYMGKGNANDIAPSQVVPAMYYIQPLNDKWATGLAIYSNYGTGTEYEKDYIHGTAAGKTHIISVNFNPNISYRVNEQLSLGAGVSFVYATAELKRNLGGTHFSVANMEGDGHGFGWNIGALYEVNENNRFGISYKSKVKTELEGDYSGVDSVIPKDIVNGTLDINLPSILEVSGYHKLTNKFAVSYSWMYTTWSDFGDIVAESEGCKGGECLKKEEDFNNSSRYAIGGEYYVSEAVTLRAGYAFDEQAGKSSLSIPDTDRQWYTAGISYKATPRLSFDFATALIAGKESTFDEVVPGGGPFPDRNETFTASGDAWIYSAQVNYSF